MNALLWSRTTVVWLILVAATALSYSVGHGLGISDVRTAAVVILVTTFVKVWFVIFEFMEVRGAPVWMRRAAGGWVVGIAAVLIARVLIGP